MRKHSEDLRPRPIAPDQAADRGHPNQSSDHYQRIAFVQSRWHKDLVDQSRTAFIAEIRQLGVAESQITFEPAA